MSSDNPMTRVLLVDDDEAFRRIVSVELTRRGYLVHPRSGWTAEFGGAGAILIGADGSKQAGADRRREAWSPATR